MAGLLRLARPLNCAMAAVGVGIGGIVAVGSQAWGSLALPLVLAGVAAASFTAGGNALNDLYDRETDRVNHPKRPLPSGQLRLETAKAFIVAAFFVAAAVASFISVFALAVVAINAAAMFAYEAALKARGASGNLVISYLVGSLFFFAGVSVYTSSWDPLIRTGILAALAFVTTLGREITKDIEDLRGDVDRRTLPRRIGASRAGTLAATSHDAPRSGQADRGGRRVPRGGSRGRGHRRDHGRRLDRGDARQGRRHGPRDQGSREGPRHPVPGERRKPLAPRRRALFHELVEQQGSAAHRRRAASRGAGRQGVGARDDPDGISCRRAGNARGRGRTRGLDPSQDAVHRDPVCPLRADARDEARLPGGGERRAGTGAGQGHPRGPGGDPDSARRGRRDPHREGRRGGRGRGGPHPRVTVQSRGRPRRRPTPPAPWSGGGGLMRVLL